MNIANMVMIIQIVKDVKMIIISTEPQYVVYFDKNI